MWRLDFQGARVVEIGAGAIPNATILCIILAMPGITGDNNSLGIYNA
jgi:hypothetical protein